MKKLILALALCAFVATPAMADNHGHAEAEESVKSEEVVETAKPVAKKKKKRAAKAVKKVTTETTQEGEEAPSEATHN